MRYVISILIAALTLFGCASGESTDKNVSELDTYEGLSAALSDSDEIALYDVRTDEEYVGGHIPGSFNIPYDVIGDEIQIEDKDATIVVYCRTGNRSGQAKKTLEALGYTNVTNFGGVNNWQGDLILGPSPE
jgi:rhodanese-related sulfurtransferase